MRQITKDEYLAMNSEEKELARIYSLIDALENRPDTTQRVNSLASQDPMLLAARKRQELAFRILHLRRLNRPVKTSEENSAGLISSTRVKSPRFKKGYSIVKNGKVVKIRESSTIFGKNPSGKYFGPSKQKRKKSFRVGKKTYMIDRNSKAGKLMTLEKNLEVHYSSGLATNIFDAQSGKIRSKPNARINAFFWPDSF